MNFLGIAASSIRSAVSSISHKSTGMDDDTTDTEDDSGIADDSPARIIMDVKSTNSKDNNENLHNFLEIW